MKKLQQKKNASRSFPVYIPVLVLFVFSFLLYANTLHHSYALDDDIVSRKNQFVQEGFSGIPAIFSHGFFYGFNQDNEQAYRPVPLMTLAVETGIWGETPGIHHLFNVLYYAISCGLLFLLTKRMFRETPILIPFLMALLFAAHPVHTECVANFKSRDEVLNLLFMVVMLLFLLRFADSVKISSLAAATLFYSLALLTKEQSVTFLAVVPLVLYWFSSLPLKRILLVLLPFGVMTLGYFFLRTEVLASMTFSEAVTLDNNSLVAATSISDRLATALLILGKYVLVLLFPHPLSYDYSFNQIPVTGLTNPMVMMIVLLFTLAGIGCVLFLRRRNIFVFSFLFFIITISVVSNILFLIGTAMGERFLLIPSFAFCVSAVWIGTVIPEPLNRWGGIRRDYLFYSVILLITSVFAVQTVVRNQDWKNNLTLYTSGVKTAPGSYRTHTMLAFEYVEQAKLCSEMEEKRQYVELAEQHYRNSIRIYPGSAFSLYNFAVLKIETGKPAEALDLLREAVKADPNDYNSWNNLAVVSFQEGHIDSALRYMLKLEKLKPGDPAIVDAIGVVYSRKNDYDNAVGYFRKALTIDPSRTRTYDNLIELLVNHGDTARARYYRGLALMNGR